MDEAYRDFLNYDLPDEIGYALFRLGLNLEKPGDMTAIRNYIKELLGEIKVLKKKLEEKGND